VTTADRGFASNVLRDISYASVIQQRIGLIKMISRIKSGQYPQRRCLQKPRVIRLVSLFIIPFIPKHGRDEKYKALVMRFEGRDYLKT
jgi:hypothetical protein